jgi:DNA-binding NarL/FixJ family response regulator
MVGSKTSRRDGTAVGGGPKAGIRVLVVEDDEDFLRSLIGDFGRDGMALILTHSLAEARRILSDRKATFDAVLLKTRLPDGNGEALLPDLDAMPRQPATIITDALLHELQPASLEYRPVAMPRSAGISALLDLVKSLTIGYRFLLIRRFSFRFRLSTRETQALLLMAHGLRAKGIATSIGCTDPTVYGYLARICEKTGARDSTEILAKLLAFACQELGHTPPEYPAFVGD